MALEKYFSKIVSSIEDNGQNVVITTYSGAAAFVAQVIDENKVSNVLGTIAGDTNILVILKDVSKVSETKNAIADLLK
jgi:arginine repressor